MGTATLAVSKAVSQNVLLQSADKRQAERLPCRHKRAGRGTVLSAGKAAFRKGCCQATAAFLFREVFKKS